MRRRAFLGSGTATVAVSSLIGPAAGKAAATSLLGGTFAGYQGWFGCPGDAPDRSWQHWLRPDGSLLVDILPDMKGVAPEDACVTPLRHADGSPVLVFSSQNPHIVRGHFRFLQQRGIQGAALQRFIVALKTPELTAERDQVLTNVIHAAQQTGRTFYLEYDITGADAESWSRTLLADWRRLCDVGLTVGPAYQHHAGRPVLSLYGFGYADRPATPAGALALIEALEAFGPEVAPTLCGAVPWDWRSLDAQQKAWAPVYARLTIISPWTVGAYTTPREAKTFFRHTIATDLAFTAARGQLLMPVVYPGFSSANRDRNPAKLNKISRAGGKFLDTQMHCLQAIGADAIFLAMLDEFDEGTAMLPEVAVSPRIQSEPLKIGDVY